MNRHPYIIDPKTRTNGEAYLQYNKRRWGSDSWTHSLREAGRPDGTPFADWQWYTQVLVHLHKQHLQVHRWPNTMQAHRLVLLAQAQGKAHATTEALFAEQYAHPRTGTLLAATARPQV